MIAMRRFAVTIRTIQNLQDTMTGPIEKCVQEASAMHLAEGDIVCIVASLIVGIFKADREQAAGGGHGQPTDIAKAEQKSSNLMLLAAIGNWPRNLQNIRGQWVGKGQEKGGNKEARKGLRGTSSGGPGGWEHCIPFQHGKWTGAACPKSKKHVIVACKRSYVAGSKCTFGDKCFFGHP